MSSSDFDTGKQHLANVYAKALLGAAQTGGQAGGQVEAVLDELQSLIAQVFDRSPGLEEVLVSPRVDESEKAALIDRILGGKISDLLLNFLKVMARHGRLDCLRATLQAAQRQFNDLRGRREVFVTTAEPIGGEAVEQIAAQLRIKLKADIELHLAVDPALLGGLVVRVGDTVYDGSIAQQLVRFRDEAAAKATQEMRTGLQKFLATA
jgi:F-type H+-transporting ATPase subunit delta